jgi:hypothetical protein
MLAHGNKSEGRHVAPHGQINQSLLLLLNTVCLEVPKFLMHNAQDFVQILYFAGSPVRIINENNVFHSFFRLGNHMSPIFGVNYCQIFSYFLTSSFKFLLIKENQSNIDVFPTLK